VVTEAFVVAGPPQVSLPPLAAGLSSLQHLNSGNYLIQGVVGGSALADHHQQPSDALVSSSQALLLGAVTVDPTAFLNDVLAGPAAAPALLLGVPVLAALALVSLLAYALVSYASPAEPDD
jgi:hypothetical protein